MATETEYYNYQTNFNSINKGIITQSSSRNKAKKNMYFTPINDQIKENKTNFVEHLLCFSDEDEDTKEDEVKLEDENLKRRENKSISNQSENGVKTCKSFVGFKEKNLPNPMQENTEDKNDSNNEPNIIFNRNNRALSIKLKKMCRIFENEINSYTNTENISDFYEYTNNCFKKILELPPKRDLKESEYVNISFNNDKKTLIFDLDETLIHCIGEIKENDAQQNYHKSVDITLPTKKTIKVGINIRPFLYESLDILKEHYNLILYTASHQSYTDGVLKIIDPEKKYFKYRLFRYNCTQIKMDNSTFYIKNLDIFKNIDLKDLIIIDNSVLSFAYHLDNGVPILPYYQGNEDNELKILTYYLIFIYHDKDLRESNNNYINLRKLLKSVEEDREKKNKKKIEKIKKKIFKYQKKFTVNEENEDMVKKSII